MSRLDHLLNAEFDLSLRPRWRPPGGASARRRIDDLAWHGLFLARDHDSVLVPEPAPDDFCELLDLAGLSVPAVRIVDDDDLDRLSPFGWNARAAELNRRSRSPAPHPDLETVTRVNGRRFSAALERELCGGGHTVAEARTEGELRRRLGELPEADDGWIVKAEHGNAGLGNRRLRNRRIDGGDLTAVRRLLDEDDGVVVERWRPRLRDLCATFEVTDRGTAADVGLHETVTTADGALIGALFERDHEPLAEWRPAMTDTVRAVADRLAAEGFFGPACIDGFVWSDRGRPRLRPLVDLNARRQMSAGAARLWHRLGARGAAYWRFFTRRKLRLPASYRELDRALGRDAYDPDRRAGVLPTSPLWLGPDRRAPAKAAILLLGSDRAEVLALDRRFRARFES